MLEKVWLPDEEAIDTEEELAELTTRDEELTELAVWICTQCWNGGVQLPLMTATDFVDQGIDMFFHQHPLKETHKCKLTNIEALPPSRDRDIRLAFGRATRSHGNWISKKIAIPIAVKDRMLEHPLLTPGPTTSTDRLNHD